LAWEPSEEIQITVLVGGTLFPVFVPGALELEFPPACEPVALGRVWLCGWSAWLWVAPLNRAEVVEEFEVPVEPPTEWLCAPMACVWLTPV
jgi:hypothetical protein